MKNPAFFIATLCLSLGLVCCLPIADLAASENEALSRTESRIDELVGKKLAETNTKANPPVDDATFLRRIYLDVAGRIPTLEEGRAFLDSAEKDKRSQLIDELLASEAAVSHDFNYWADVLRISELVGNMRLVTFAYGMWLKDALRSNIPYDEMVRQMITARGFLWENGATGYYHRDRGMPLDNMSNTVRVFLGTRLECAQCHDHPFDKWTQMDYYKMAAFSYSMDARLWAPPGRLAIGEYQKEFVTAANARGPNGRMEPNGADYLRYRGMNQVNADLFAFMKFVYTRETPQTLTLPHDYQYSDAEPESPVAPATMYGAEIDAKNADDLIESYADWMTSTEHPRFAQVIVNRLWKRAFGRGLVEPVDEFMDHSAENAQIPELLTYLSERIVELDFDVRALRSEIYHSRAYQSQSTGHDVTPGAAYAFPGPLLRRLSAEQLWDSMVTLSIGAADYYMPQLNSRLTQLDRLRRVRDSFSGKSDEELIELAKKYADVYADSYLEIEDLQARFTAAVAEKDEPLIAELRKKLGQVRGQQTTMVRTMAHGGKQPKGDGKTLYENFGIGGRHLPLEKIETTLRRPEKRPGTAKENSEWSAFTAGMTRASEVQQPAPRGHFLREFGQSDREQIENYNLDGSVPQALNLLNGPYAEALANPNSLLQRNLAEVESEADKLDALFLSVLSRPSTAGERKVFEAEIAKDGDAAYDAIVWVLLNSQQFRFLN